MRKSRIKLFVGFAAAFLLLGVFTWQVGWAEIQQIVSRSQMGLLVGGMLVAFGGIMLMGVSWWVMVKPVAGIGFLDGLKVFFSTNFANSITPFGQLGGEPFIAYILSRDADIPLGESFGAVLAADIVNTVPFFSMTILGMILYTTLHPVNRFAANVMIVLLVLAALTFGALVFVWKDARPIVKVFGIMGRFGNWFTTVTGLEKYGALGRVNRENLREKGRTLHQIFHTLLRDWKRVLVALTITHLANLLGAVGLYLILLSLGVTPPLTGLLFVLPASLIASYLPLPGGLGGIEIAMVLLLVSVLGIPSATATAGALLFRIPTYWSIILIGGTLSSMMSVDFIAGGRPMNASAETASPAR